MITQTHIETEKDVVKNMRKIRDTISNEIMDMGFEEQRKYMDRLLKDSQSSNTPRKTAVKKAEE